ncbi:acyl-CoA dehydrogenase family protein [Candidatus Poriferisocius sp.]|uniref:acyl-CoA dehydrogenase family protein n=1 Tax=Candidatus Poriferisocius sp. TaxID=3101276 RepID=UPI003B010C23
MTLGDLAARDGVLTPEREAVVERVRALGPALAARSAKYDRDASFPYENWQDLAEAGLLAICIPKSAGGLGADFVGYALASEELGRHCAATGLTFNMHVCTTLLVGQIADDMELDSQDRSALLSRRAELWQGIVEHGRIHSQPFSEGIAAGATEGYATTAVPVDNGYRVSGRKIFASLSGAADIHNVVCVVEGDPRVRLLGVAADSDGLHIEGEWDSLGMRATDSRNLVLEDVFVPAEREWIPTGMFDQAAARWPYFFMTLSFAYLGLMGAIMDATAEYLIGDGETTARRSNPIKQQGWAEMNLIYDRAQALCYRVLAESGVDPEPDAVRRAWSSMVSTMDGAPQLASLALRVCGGRALLRPSRLEQFYRDARCGAAMHPWSMDVCLERLGRAGLFDDATENPV